uniref:Uncharacterized protein n=1 Tax=Fagus sylvatica TaxID=28930 RepID=A0A2N9IAG6_FAGSY
MPLLPQSALFLSRLLCAVLPEPPPATPSRPLLAQPPTPSRPLLAQFLLVEFEFVAFHQVSEPPKTRFLFYFGENFGVGWVSGWVWGGFRVGWVWVGVGWWGGWWGWGGFRGGWGGVAGWVSGWGWGCGVGGVGVGWVSGWVAVVVGFVVGGGFFLLIVVGSGVGCGGWQRWVWVVGRGGFVLRCSKHTM